MWLKSSLYESSKYMQIYIIEQILFNIWSLLRKKKYIIYYIIY